MYAKMRPIVLASAAGVTATHNWTHSWAVISTAGQRTQCRALTYHRKDLQYRNTRQDALVPEAMGDGLKDDDPKDPSDVDDWREQGSYAGLTRVHQRLAIRGQSSVTVWLNIPKGVQEGWECLK